MNLDNITSDEFLEAKEKAKRNGVDKIAFREMRSQLKNFPRSEERLFFELSGRAIKSLEADQSPKLLVANALLFETSVSNEKLPVFADVLEKIARHSFRRLGVVENAEFGESVSLQLTLSLALLALRKRDVHRFETVYHTLLHNLEFNDPRYRVLAEITGKPYL